MRRRVGERGQAVAVEAALIIPALAMFIALVVVLAQTALAQQAVTAAAHEAARAAGLERNVRDAGRAADEAVASALTAGGIDCVRRSQDVDLSDIAAPMGSVATVDVSVTCVVRFDLSLPGFPGERSVTGHGSSPVDTYRGR